MKIANTLITFLVVSLAAEISVASTYGDFQQFRRGAYKFELESQYFKSEANYISSGDSYQKLPTGQWYELWNVFINTRYDFSKRSALYGNLNVAIANSAGFDANRSNSSLADAMLGFAYMPYSDAFDLIADFSFRFPFNSINENTDTVMNTEGVMEGTGLLRVQKQFSTLAPFAYIGGMYRQNRSALLPWAVGTELHWTSFILGGKVFGYQTIMDDPDKDKKIQRLVVSDRVNGGSLKFYAVNPSLVDSELYIKFKMTKEWAISVGGGATLTGSASAAGFHGGASISYYWDSQPSYYLRRGSELSIDGDPGSDDKKPIFKEEVNDGVDQKIFDMSPAKSRQRKSP